MAAADGRFVDAVRAAIPAICTDDEIAALEETGFFERWAGGVPAMLQMVQQAQSCEGPQATDPEVLEKITAPVLLMVGQETRFGIFADSVQYVAKRVAESHVRELPGVGHFAPVLAPEPIAEELIQFFAPRLADVAGR